MSRAGHRFPSQWAVCVKCLFVLQRTINISPLENQRPANHHWRQIHIGRNRQAERLYVNYTQHLHLTPGKPKAQGFCCTSKLTKSQRSVYTRSCSEHRRLDTFAILYKSYTWLTLPLCLCVLVSVFVTHTHTQKKKPTYTGMLSQVEQEQSCSGALLYFNSVLH